MSMRCIEPGWIRVTEYDKAERRALWMRVTEGAVEFCAGRDGDDAYVKIPRQKESLNREGLYNLQDVGRTAEWGVYERDGDDDDIEDKIWDARGAISNLMKLCSRR